VRICVFCSREVGESAVVCVRCREYKGIVEAYRCSCGGFNPVSAEKCEDCGKRNRKRKQ